MDPILGQIILWSGTFIPSGWLPCDGRSLPITANQALFSIIGITYGGDGRTNFNLPDLRSIVPIGVDARVANQGGLLGKTTGAAINRVNAEGVGSATITTNNLPSHTHSATFTPGSPASGTASVEVKIPVMNTPATATATNTPAENTVLGVPVQAVKPFNTGAANTNLLPFQATGTATVPAGPGTVTVANTGNGAALSIPVVVPLSLSTMQPSLFLNYIIAIQGIYPTRD